jgi:hypothetical protein
MTLVSQPMPSPDDPVVRRSSSELAAVVASTAAEVEKELAMIALRPAIERVATVVASGAPGDLARRMRQDAWGIMWEKLTRPGAGYDPALNFEPWCRTVLANHLIDLTRRRARDPVDLARPGSHELTAPSEVERLPADSDRAEAAEQARLTLEESLEEVRSWLDRVGRRWADREVDFYPVFLLHLRQGLVNRLSRTWAAESSGLPPGEMSSVAERCLPWHAVEEALAFRAAWPRLAEIWAALRPFADSPPYRLEGDAVCGALTRLRGGTTLTVACWHQWTRRARERARSLIAPDAWESFFAPWLPVPRPAGRPPESEP